MRWKFSSSNPSKTFLLLIFFFLIAVRKLDAYKPTVFPSSAKQRHVYILYLFRCEMSNYRAYLLKRLLILMSIATRFLNKNTIMRVLSIPRNHGARASNWYSVVRGNGEFRMPGQQAVFLTNDIKRDQNELERSSVELSKQYQPSWPHWPKHLCIINFLLGKVGLGDYNMYVAPKPTRSFTGPVIVFFLLISLLFRN